MRKAWDKYAKYLDEKIRRSRGSGEGTRENSQEADEQDPSPFQSFFKDQDPAFLQQTTEQHLVHAGYGGEGALLVTGAATVIKLIEVVGPYAAVLLI